MAVEATGGRLLVALLLQSAIGATSCGRVVEFAVDEDSTFVASTDAASDTSVDSNDTATTGCSPLDPAACAEGEKCLPTSSGDTACVLAGELGLGDRCGVSGLDDCQSGLLCAIYHQGEDLLRCAQICNPSAPECPVAQTCTATMSVGPTLGVCQR